MLVVMRWPSWQTDFWLLVLIGMIVALAVYGRYFAH